MQGEQEYSHLIYEYFLTRIRFQYFKYGDTLPAIDTLYRAFTVSDGTVKAALQRLRQEGYISMRNGKPTKVIFRQSEQEREKFAMRFFAQRKAAFADLKESATMVSVPMLLEGFRRMDGGDFALLASLAQRANPIDLLRFYFHVFEKLDNPLVMNLFWEISLFQGFPLLDVEGALSFYDSDFTAQKLGGLIALAKKQAWGTLQEALRLFQRQTTENALRYIRRHVESMPERDQIPFVWHIYRDRPQICYSLTVQMLCDIYLGDYRHLRYLPSYEKMARKYSVSVSTMRRTVRLLNQLGTVRTINGKGTEVYTIGENSAQPDWSCPAIRRNMALYFQAYEMMLYSCEDASHTLLLSLSQQEKEKLAGQLKAFARAGQYDLTLWSVMIAIASRSPLQAVREIYGKIFGLFLWGYPLKASGGSFPDFDQAAARLTKQFIRCLEAGALDQCAAAVKEFVTREFPIAEKYLHELGFSREALRTPQCIKLLLPETLA